MASGRSKKTSAMHEGPSSDEEAESWQVIEALHRTFRTPQPGLQEATVKGDGGVGFLPGGGSGESPIEDGGHLGLQKLSLSRCKMLTLERQEWVKCDSLRLQIRFSGGKLAQHFPSLRVCADHLPRHGPSVLVPTLQMRKRTYRNAKSPKVHNERQPGV